MLADIQVPKNAGTQNFTAGTNHFPLVDMMIPACIDMADGYVNLIIVLVRQYDQSIYSIRFGCDYGHRKYSHSH